MAILWILQPKKEVYLIKSRGLIHFKDLKFEKIFDLRCLRHCNLGYITQYSYIHQSGAIKLIYHQDNLYQLKLKHTMRSND